jgi:hypothetical protein
LNRARKWALGLGIAAAALGAVWLAIAWWLPTDEDLTARLTAEAEARLGVKVTIASAHWRLTPRLVVVVNDFRTQQAHPIVIGKLTAHPDTGALLRRKFVMESIAIEDAAFPRGSIRALHLQLDKPDASDDVPIERFTFRNVTWTSYSGIAVAYDGEIEFDPHWRPRHAELRHSDSKSGFKLEMKREGDEERWQTLINVGGGTAHGTVALKTDEKRVMHLSGQLAPREIEVARAMTSFNRRSPVGGKGSGKTVLSAEGTTLAELIHTLHTRTTFAIHPATVLRFDLEKALATKGKDHSGQTPLEELTGQLDTQNTDEGLRVTYTGLKARSGKYSAQGNATIYHRQIDAKGTLYVADGAVGVPFTLVGPIEKPKATMPPGMLAGAVIGTKVLPGAGTRIGASIGGTLGRIFKPGQKKAEGP